MERIPTNGVEIACEVTGRGEPLVLVMGVGAQMVYWPAGFVERLVRRGFQVIRFDHRDIGRSTWLDDLGTPSLQRNMVASLIGLGVQAPYTLGDMAGDVVGLLDALGHRRAHVAGVSMGGMVAQVLAIEHGDRVATMTSIMSTPGKRRYWLMSDPRAVAALLSRVPREREALLDRQVELFRVLHGDELPYDAAAVRARAAEALDLGGLHPQGFVRHMAAILASGDRTDALGEVDVPGLAIHGTADPLMPPAAGEATARALPNGRLEWVEGMGHSLPEARWDRLVDAIAAHAARA